jgi:hypothetical protein
MEENQPRLAGRIALIIGAAGAIACNPEMPLKV